MKRTDLSSVGEFGLIELLEKKAELKNDSTVKGIGDDAAVLNYTDKKIVVTTDLLVEGIHYNLTYVPLKHLGYKAVVVNLSDVYAMNAQAKHITVSIGISNKFYIEAVDEIYEGIRLACEHYGVDLVGGDTTSTQTGSVISITAMGEADTEDIVYRSGARKGDLICVSGDLGAAYAGLQLLEREQALFKADPSASPILEGYEYILERQLKPEARRDIVDMLKSEGIKPTAMIDVSDGLSSEVLHICKQSGTGARLFEDKIPVAEQTKKMADELRIDVTTLALNGGEDYELLFTISQSDYDKLKSNPYISIIGHVTDTGAELITRDGTSVELKAQGWKNFSQV